MAKPAVFKNNILNALIPISRFNRGEAGKIFDEVKDAGTKLVVKNNQPACVLMPPEEYQAMVEAIEDYALYVEAETRLKGVDAESCRSLEEVADTFQIDLAVADAGDVELA